MAGTPHRTAHEQEAYDLGVEHAKNAASWVTDGNTDLAHYVRLLKMMDDGDPEAENYLPACPNLSGEYADGLTPSTLYHKIVGYERSSWDDPKLVGALADGYEAGVMDTFQPECERLLREATA